MHSSTQFSGSDRLIADYLSTEVLDALSPTRRRILLQLSALDEMSPELVAYVFDDDFAGLLLDELSDESMFLIASNHRPGWCRFHHLFRDLLRYHLRTSDSGEEARLAVRAATWHNERGDVDAGLEYLLRAERWDEAIRIVLTSGTEIFERGEMVRVLRWISRIPDTVRERNVELSLLEGTLEAISGNLARGEGLIAKVLTRSDVSRAEFTCAQVVLATMAQWRPHPDRSRIIALGALDALNELGDETMPNILGLSSRRSAETLVMAAIGRSYLLEGKLAEAREWLDRTLLTEGAQYPVWRSHVLGSLALIEIWTGRSARAIDLATEALTAADGVGLLGHPATGDAYLALAQCAIERADVGNAALAAHEGLVRANANGRTQLAWIAQLELATLDDEHIPAVGQAPPIVAERMAALTARRQREAGSVPIAFRGARGAMTRGSSLVFEEGAAAMMLSDVTAAERAITELAALPFHDEPLPLIRALILRSWLAAAREERGRANRLLTEALEVGEVNDLVEVFARAGGVTSTQIAALPPDGSTYRARILARSGELRSPPVPALLPEGLTMRELEILRYLPTRLTAAEIARTSFVSTNTVKTHISHIYRKLDVVDRNMAVKRAAEIGLI